MDANRRSQCICAIIWPLWVGILMGMPYLCSFDVAQGAVALDSTYVWVALGLCLGLALGAHPVARTYAAQLRPITFSTAGGIGCAMTLCLACGEWANAATSPITSLLGLIPQATPLTVDGSLRDFFYSFPFGVSVFQALCTIGRYEGLIAFCCAMLCGLFGQTLLIRLRGTGRTDAASARRSASRFPTLPLGAVLLFLLGFLRPYAWLLFLPHSPFPLPRAFYDVFMLENTWSPVGVALAVPVLAAGLLAAGALGWAITGHPSHARVQAPAKQVSGQCGFAHPHRLVYAFVSFCAGELAFRIASRVEPRLFQPSEALVWAGAVAFVLVLVALSLVFGHEAFAGWRCILAPDSATSHPETHPIAAEQPTTPSANQAPPVTLDVLRAALAPDRVAKLEAQGLTGNEIDAVRAHICNLTSAHAAELLGIKPSTLREYRRRASKKLGAGTLDEAAARVRARMADSPGVPEASDHPDGDPAAPACLGNTGMPVATVVARCGFVAVFALFAGIVLPFGDALRSWDGIWVAAYGVGLGLVLTWGLDELGWGERLPTAARVAQTAALAASFAGLVAERLGWVAGDTSSPGGKALGIALFAVFTACCCRFLRSLAPAAFPAARRRAGLPPQPHPALRFAVITTLACAWEEVWRGQVYASLARAFTVFLALTAAALCLALWRDRAVGRASCILAAAAAVAAVPFKGVTFGLVLGILVLACIACALAYKAAPARDSALIGGSAQADMPQWAPLAAALGCFAGNWLVNAYGSALLASPGATIGPLAVETLVTWATGIVLGLLGAAYFVATVRALRTCSSTMPVHAAAGIHPASAPSETAPDSSPSGPDAVPEAADGAEPDGRSSIAEPQPITISCADSPRDTAPQTPPRPAAVPQ